MHFGWAPSCAHGSWGHCPPCSPLSVAQRALHVEQYSNRPGAKVVGFEEGAKKLLGGRLRSRDQTPLECFGNLANVLLQIPCYPPLVWILASN